MINACLDADYDGLSLAVDGHSGSAPRGEDLICAAASILIQTLVENLRGINAYELGDGHFKCYVTEAELQPLVTFAADGLRLLSEEYPEYVSYKQKVIFS